MLRAAACGWGPAEEGGKEAEGQAFVNSKAFPSINWPTGHKMPGHARDPGWRGIRSEHITSGQLKPECQDIADPCKEGGQAPEILWVPNPYSQILANTIQGSQPCIQAGRLLRLGPCQVPTCFQNPMILNVASSQTLVTQSISGLSGIQPFTLAKFLPFFRTLVPWNIWILCLTDPIPAFTVSVSPTVAWISWILSFAVGSPTTIND